LAKVEVAAVPVRLRYGVVRPVYIDEVAELLKLAEFCIEKREPGEVVPTPTRSLKSTVKAVLVEEPTEKNALVAPAVVEACTESKLHGVVVPTPTLLSMTMSWVEVA
jgi:hypothetical protein